MGVHSGLTNRAIRGSFFKRLEETAESSWVRVASHMFDSDQESETYKSLGNVPALRHWIGARQKSTPTPYSLTIVNKKYESSVEFDVDDMRREKVNQINVRIRDLASRAALLPQKTLTDDIIEANATAYDGTALFADRSSLKTGGRINNILSKTWSDPDVPTTAEMTTALLDGVELFMTALDDQGEPMNEFAREFMCMVPPAYLGALTGAIRDQFTSAGVSNTFGGLLQAGFAVRPVVNPRLPAPSSTGKFYLFRVDSDVKPLIWQDEVATDLDELGEGSDYEFFNDAHVYGVKRIGNGAAGEPAMAVRVDVS